MEGEPAKIEVTRAGKPSRLSMVAAEFLVRGVEQAWAVGREGAKGKF
jgi:hypothetical protein